MLEGAGIEAVERLNQIVDKIPPLLTDVETRLFGGLHGLLDRVECEFHFKINPAKAKAANPTPEADKIY